MEERVEHLEERRLMAHRQEERSTDEALMVFFAFSCAGPPPVLEARAWVEGPQQAVQRGLPGWRGP